MASQSTQNLASAITQYEKAAGTSGSGSAMQALMDALDKFKQDAVHQAILTAQRQISVATVSTSAPLTNTGGPNPTIGLTIPLPVADGGTGSTTQPFVDLTTNQTVGGTKTFTSPIIISGEGAVPVLLGPTGSPISSTAQTKVVANVTAVTATTLSGSVYIGSTAVTLSGAAAFTSSLTYRVVANAQVGANTNAQVWVYTLTSSGTSFNIAVVSNVSATVGVNWEAIGY